MKRLGAPWGLLLVLAAGLLGAAEAGKPQPKAAYAFKLSPTAHGPNLLLGDVIEGLEGPAAAKVVRPAGRPGAKLKVEAAVLRHRLRQAIPGADLAPGQPSSLSVEVPVQRLPGSTLRQFAENYLKERLSGSAGVRIEARGPVRDLDLYDPPATLKVRPPANSDYRGAVVLGVVVEQLDGQGQPRAAAEVPVSFWVQRRETRLVAQRQIGRGSALRAEDVSVVEMDGTREPAGLYSLDEAAGMTTRQVIPVGKVITLDMLERPDAVKRGDLVRVIVRSGSVVVESSGKALRSAKLGESLPVEMEGTRKMVQGKCVADGVVVHETP